GLFGSLGSGPVETTQRKSDLEDSRGYEAFHWLVKLMFLCRQMDLFWMVAVPDLIRSCYEVFTSGAADLVSVFGLPSGCLRCRMAAVPDCFGFQNQLLGSGFEDFSCRDLLWVYMFFGSDSYWATAPLHRSTRTSSGRHTDKDNDNRQIEAMLKLSGSS
ncbi:hypothetical protein U1Q18_027848, partial [Sarracenia purpurea var. burkii]